MLMMTSQILTSMHFTKTQKSKYFENETLFFLQIKKNSLITKQGLLYCNKGSNISLMYSRKKEGPKMEP